MALRAIAEWAGRERPRVELAHRTRSGAPSIPDLLIAATAEKASLTVLVVDKDFDLIAEIIGQLVETLALT